MDNVRIFDDAKHVARLSITSYISYKYIMYYSLYIIYIYLVSCYTLDDLDRLRFGFERAGEPATLSIL